jgi:hypothetical protein
MSALAEIQTSSCNTRDGTFFSAISTNQLMNRLPLRPIAVALCVTLAQIAVALFLLAPDGPFSARYATLIQHDSYWFMNIVNRGYGTTVPPIGYKTMEISNVAFFPAYPAIAALVHYVVRLDTTYALLITAQAAAFGFWSYFFLFCQRWNISPLLQFFGALSILAHPAAFFLVAGYSESLFLMALVGFIYWGTTEGRTAKVLAAIHGIVMSATRIVGLPCAAFPVVRSLVARGWRSLHAPRSWLRQYGNAIALTLVAMLGALLFFAYCQLRWGNWNLYMLTQAAGWGISPDYLAVFKPSSYRWLVPALHDPTEASQMSVPLGALLFGAIAICEIVMWRARGRSGPVAAATQTRPAASSDWSHRAMDWPMRAGIYFCGFTVFYLSISGVASVNMESMLRYEFSVHALLVLAFLNFLGQFETAPKLLRAFGMGAVALACAAGLSMQAWYVWNFTRGNWVA